jgi:hypothetical protein
MERATMSRGARSTIVGAEDAQAGQPGRVELVKLHVLQWKPLAEHDA